MEAGADIQCVTVGIDNFSGVKGRFYSYISSNKSMVIDDSTLQIRIYEIIFEPAKEFQRK